MKKIMKWTGIVLGGLISLALLAGLARYPSGMEKLTRSYPGFQPDFWQWWYCQVLHRRRLDTCHSPWRQAKQSSRNLHV